MTAFNEHILYHDDYWHVNPGDEKIHAARLTGRFRNYKWTAASLWLIFFTGPYIRWMDRQAVLWDIPNRKFHIFGMTLWPQDIWMLALVLIFLALVLFAATAVAGRVFCGYFCFQTVWTDIFTLIEDRLEGPPAKRRQLDKAPWNFEKMWKKGVKHILWISIGLLTGITFAAYFADAFWMWKAYLSLTAPPFAWVTLLFFVLCTYIFAGFMREQVCFWLCPYARIQGVMYDKDTILPTYDAKRGEPRARPGKGEKPEGTGDCIACNLCVAVCPTGIDIRHGQQEGCITCGLCIDACDAIMDRVGRQKGLIRYASLDEIEGTPQPSLFKRPRVIVYSAVLFTAFSGIAYGLLNLGALGLNVIHERQPLYVMLSDGSIQNKYTLKIVNKMERELMINISVEGPEGAVLNGVENPVAIKVDKVVALPVWVNIPRKNIQSKRIPVIFALKAADFGGPETKYESKFFAP